MKRILFVNNTMGRAGAETALMELLRVLTARGGYDISLFVLVPYGEMFDEIPSGVRILNKRYSSRPLASLRGRLGIARAMIGSFFYKLTGFRLMGYFARNIAAQRKAGRFQFEKLFWRMLATGTPPRREEYDLAVGYLEGASTYYVAQNVRAARKASFMHIDYESAGYLPMMDMGCYDTIDRVFTVSAEVRRKFCGVYPQHSGKVFIFRNIVNRERILKKADEGAGFEDGYQGVRLITVGRLHYQKGYDIAVEALALLKSRGYNVRWYVVGEGGERAALESQIEARGLKDDFILLGAKNNPYPYMRMADVYVHTARFEGWGIVIQEAQILGRAIAATNCTGCTEQIVDGYDGLLYTLSAENIAATVARILDDPELKRTLIEHVQQKNPNHPEDVEHFLELLNE